MRLTTSLIFILSAFTVLGQFGITVNGNYSIIGSHTTMTSPSSGLDANGFATLTPSYTLKESYESRGGYGISINYNQSITDKFEVISGIDYSSISFKRNTEVIYESFDSFNGDDTIIGSLGGLFNGFNGLNGSESLPDIANSGDVGETTITYLTIPIYATYGLTDKIRIGLGLKNSFVVGARETQLIYTANFNGGTISETVDKSKQGFRTYNLISSLIIQYSINDNWAVETTCNQGISAIYEDEKQVAGSARMRNVTIGINYRL